MANKNDKSIINDIHDGLMDEFDIDKAINDIEEENAREEAERAKREAERAKRQQAASSAKKPSRGEMRERRKEAEWLGEAFDEETGTSRPVKKRSKAGIVILILLILGLAAGGGAYAFKMQNDNRIVAQFDQKVASFKSEKLDTANLGADQEYFDDFMDQCQTAIDKKDLDAIAELESQWSEVEQKLSEVTAGSTALEAFVKTMNETLSSYAVTDGVKEDYDALMADVKKAQDENNYSKVSELQKRLDALVTNMKSDNQKTVQNLKNDIAAMDLDDSYTTDEQKKKLSGYSDSVDKELAENNYAGAVATLNEWKTTAVGIEASVESKKTESESTAESEAQIKAEAEAQSRAAIEAQVEQAHQQRESYQASSSDNSGSSSDSSSSSSSDSSSSSSDKSDDYILADSSSRYLSKSDLKGLSSYELMIARNEIYARHGRKFKDSSLQSYFNNKSWYKGTIEPDDFSPASVFNDYEIKNIDLIVEAEQ